MKEVILSPFRDCQAHLKRVPDTMEFRGKTYHFLNHYYVCDESGEEFTNEETGAINFAQVYNQYREENNIPFIGEIVKLREDCMLSKTDMGRLLGFGENPALMSAQSKTDKALDGLKGQNKDNRITYYTYSNVSPIEIVDGGDPETVVNLRFATVETTTVTLWQEYKLDVQLDDEDTPAKITAHYYLDGVEEFYEPVQTIGESGTHILDLQYYLQNVEGGQARLFTVNFEVEGGSLDIAAGDIHVCLCGQGLVGSDSFIGFIEANDTVPRFVIAGLSVGAFTEGYTVDTLTNDNSTGQDNVSPYEPNTLPITFTEGTGAYTPRVYLIGGLYISTESELLLTTEDGLKLITD